MLYNQRATYKKMIHHIIFSSVAVAVAVAVVAPLVYHVMDAVVLSFISNIYNILNGMVYTK
jgi:hypothetical protein